MWIERASAGQYIGCQNATNYWLLLCEHPLGFFYGTCWKNLQILLSNRWGQRIIEFGSGAIIQWTKELYKSLVKYKMQEFKLQGAAQLCTNTKLYFGCEEYLVRVSSIQKCCREGFNLILYSKIFFVLHLYIPSCCSVSTMGECSPQRNSYVCLWYGWGESKLFHSCG